MPRQCGNSPARALAQAALCAVLIASTVEARAAEPAIAFDRAFSDRDEPASLHYRAVFSARGSEHRMEVWRDGQRRIKRRTDDAVEIYAWREPGQAEFSLSILDLNRRIHTRVDRGNLYRIGSFTDWFDLAHGLRHPPGDYRIAEVRAAVDAPAAIGACRWYALTQGARTDRICWSSRDRLPLLIQAADGQVVWKVVQVDRAPIAARTFDIHDEGFVRNDANQDIERD